MGKGLLLAAAIVLAACVAASAQEPLGSANLFGARAASTAAGAGNSNGLITLRNTNALPAPLSLIDNDPFIFMDAYSSIPLTPAFVLSPRAISNTVLLTASPAAATRLDKQLIPIQSNSNYVWGQLGGLYGTTVGSKSSLEAKEGFIIGGVGNERTQITVGASYSHWEGSLPGNFH
jgi:hypothetical protein